jgi:hypothetical protein
MSKRTCALVLGVALAAALVVQWTRRAQACAPLPPVTVFTGTQQPDFPLGPYTRGKLGVLQPGYDRIYLYVAYRNLAGRSFNRAQALALWGIPPESADLLDERPRATPAPSTPPPPMPQPVDWPHAWIDARNLVPNVAHAAYLTPWPFPGSNNTGQIPTTDGIYRSVNGPSGRYASYLNCLPSAFEAAINTLRGRTEKYGNGSPELVAWAQAQDQVFSNCLQGETIPTPLSANVSTLARVDRNYQMAAAYFYAGDFPHAESAFAAIANDHDSPWSPLAQYLVARAYIRQATVGHDDDSPDAAALTNAELHLKQVLQNPKSGDLHPSAAALLDYVEVRLHPDQKLRALAQALMQNPAPDELAQDVRDYTFLLDKLENERYSQGAAGLQANRGELYPKLAEIRRQDDLTDWILTFQLDDASARDHAYEKWQQTNSAAWLIAAISKMPPGDARAGELIAAAETVQASAPAYASVTFHRFRLMTLGGERAAALPLLNRLLAHEPGAMPRSAQNLFLALRTTYARDLGEFLKYAARVPVETGYAGFGPFDASSFPPEGSLWFDSDGLTVLNQQMTPATLTEVAESKVLPVYLRREVARGAWTRALLLGDDQAALKLAPVLAALQPELRSGLHSFTGASTTDARRFAGTLLILRFPGLRPYITSPERSTPTNRVDNLRENWWARGSPCGWAWGQGSWDVPQTGPQPDTPPWPMLESPLTELYPAGTVPPPSFLSHAEVASAARDWARTRALPVASIVLGEEVLAWAKTHPEDKSVPEALALAIRAGHFGCADPDRWKVSKAAFDLLQQKYPESSWAKQTKYWYR